ncbi:SDR family NAD(P)-dependent oxidoreductase [Phytohabitans sp. ZYX-F-186]|uniref:SDR family NAD(P)-dependent oxidoreductase n=1 Tax=Phytohabitans maris TaxID=3071409 RepID=A0ABU0ZX02_9ACTN|nr:SDR family NAD(P)-dependent oxidoreductase [Phytohabitans sp. ZYX-F-186]MDQ7910839.1 SDR family NAD(P)-dependent oxidoreductase [Phytohabitans sp. ZYX-F-186]
MTAAARDGAGLAGRSVIITGAGHGLGRQFAVAFAGQGASVVVNDIGRDEDSGRPTAQVVAEEIVEAGGRAVAHVGAVGEPETAVELVALAEDTFGRLDALVNNAAVVRQAAVEEVDLDHLDTMLRVNLRGAVLLSQEAYRGMTRRGFGRIVSLSSGAGLFGMRGQLAYGAAKAGLLGMTNVLAIEGAEHGVLANIVLPAAATNPGRTRISWPREDRRALVPRMRADLVTPLVSYLASPACRVTGRMYSAVAGRYARAFVGVTQGWLSDPAVPVSGKDVADRMDQVEDPTGYVVPTSHEGEFAAVAEQVRKAETA